MPVTVYLVRHGENPANITHEFSYRKVDYGLNDKGRLQAEQSAAFFKDKGIDALWSSPLKRAYETAQIIAAPLALPVQVHEGFREVNIGDLEGFPTLENWQLHDEIVLGWFAGKTERAFPGGENYPQLLGRFERGLRMIAAVPGVQRAVVVAHGGLFSFTLRHIVREFDVNILRTHRNHNCSITTIQIDPDEQGLNGELIEWAFHGHLSGKAAAFVSPTPRNKWDDLPQ